MALAPNPSQWEQADTNTHLVKVRPGATPPVSSKRGSPTQKSPGLDFPRMAALSRQSLSFYFSRVAQSPGPSLGLGSSSPNISRMERSCITWQRRKSEAAAGLHWVTWGVITGHRMPTSETRERQTWHHHCRAWARVLRTSLWSHP